MTPNELPASPIRVDDEALTAIDPDRIDRSKDVAPVVNDHYTSARDKVTEARERYDEHKRIATGADDPTTRGEHGALALKAHREWTQANGAVSALERLADDLGVGLDDDRRAYLPPEDRT